MAYADADGDLDPLDERRIPGLAELLYVSLSQSDLVRTPLLLQESSHNKG